MKVLKEENEDVIAVEKEEVKKQELCAVPREFVISKLNALYEDNKAIFDEHNLLVQVLNAQVNIINQEETI